MGSGDGELARGQRLGEDNCVSGKVQDGIGKWRACVQGSA